MSAFAIIAAVIFAPTATMTADGGQVTICHFDGHGGDFVTVNSEATGPPACVREGGNTITVG